MKGRSAADAIENYFPRKIPADVWQQIRDHVAEVVESSNPISYDAAEHRILAYARLCSWALRSGRPLDVEGLLCPEVVEHYVATGCGQLSLQSAGTHRSVLRTLGRQATRKAPWTDRPPTYPATTPSSPYTASESAWLMSCVPSQATPHRRRALSGLLAMCLGAGLDGPSVATVRAADIVTSSTNPNHLSVRLEDREFPVREQYAPILRQVIEPLKPDTLILRDQPLLNPSRAIWSMTNSLEIPAPLQPLTVTRLRVTWAFDALCAPIPLPVVMAMYGGKSVAFIAKLLPVLHRVDASQIASSGLHSF